jgi:hypothetical protein
LVVDEPDKCLGCRFCEFHRTCFFHGRAGYLPFTELALAETGQKVVANMVALGATAVLK